MATATRAPKATATRLGGEAADLDTTPKIPSPSSYPDIADAKSRLDRLGIRRRAVEVRLADIDQEIHSRDSDAVARAMLAGDPADFADRARLEAEQVAGREELVAIARAEQLGQHDLAGLIALHARGALIGVNAWCRESAAEIAHHARLILDLLSRERQLAADAEAVGWPRHAILTTDPGYGTETELQALVDRARDAGLIDVDDAA